MSDPDEFDLRDVTALLSTIVSPQNGGTLPPQEFLPSGTEWTAEEFLPSRIQWPPPTTRDLPFVTHLTGGGSAPPPSRSEKFKRLRYGLRCALRIEFTTIPLYLTALWSIIDQAHPAAISVRAVVHEEMLHLALLCNLLSALGERPVLTTREIVPQFPCGLPGGVHPELTPLTLEGYGPGALKTFMEIERPEAPTPIEGEDDEVFPPGDQTIGAFYVMLLAAFKSAFEEEKLTLNSDWQIAGPFAWFVMTEFKHVKNALTLIMVQGEGAPDGIPYSHDARYLSHYYRFKSLEMLTKLKWDDKTGMLKKDGAIPPPAVFTLAPASPNGYGTAAPRELRKASDKFDTTYSQMLRYLEGSWLEGGDKSFIKALELMFDLGSLAQTMMHIGTPDGRGYCPSFRYLP